ncbi:glycosyltransferase family 2 protein [uncultured Vibrio sp.]|uniref:glycosyltransferase family 2 protein n=1 Tax=uncultured Vibrio sp. TaxID=114054 RepID=UPI000914314E|nr:glycosyltransferase family 2 protein [uncultured Vibrio sp.]OIQ25375.1 MAG: hypothetical protein BM561_06320 [Vibrio sp. MedPE-SWchi]
MIKYLPDSVRGWLREIHWLASLYRKHVLRMPEFRTYADIMRLQNEQLQQLTHHTNVEYIISLNVEGYDAVSLKGLLESLILQSYPHWTLYLFSPTDLDDELSTYCSELLSQQGKPNIQLNKVTCLDDEVDIINTALLDKKESFYISLTGTGRLHRHALRAISYRLASHSVSEVIYLDHDEIGEQNLRVSPSFKPRWNPDLFYSSDYISNAVAIKATLINQIGGLSSNYGKALRYELLIRCTFHTEYIEHLPYVLFHQQSLNTLFNNCNGFAKRALATHLLPYGIDVLDGKLNGTFHVNWPLPKDIPFASIIIPTRNGKELVKQCIESIYKKTSYTNFEIILVDNQSDDCNAIEYFQQLAEQEKVRLLNYDRPFNYSAINNFAVREAKGEIIVLLNNDIEVISANWLDEMVRQVSRKEIGCVGAMLYYPDNTIQHAGVVLGLGRCAGHSHKHYQRGDCGYMNRLKVVQNYSAVTAACLGVRKSVYQQVRGLNEQDLTVAFNDVDFCIKVRNAGYRNLWSPYIEMFHHESISRGAEDTPEKKKRAKAEIAYMQETWQLDTIIDPAYSQWLTIAKEDFTFE